MSVKQWGSLASTCMLVAVLCVSQWGCGSDNKDKKGGAKPSDTKPSSTTVTPKDMPEEKPADMPEEEPSDTPEVKPADMPEEKPTETPEAKPADMPEEKPADMPEEEPSDTPEVKPADMPEEKPAETPEVKPADMPEEKPTETPEAKPADMPEEKPAETPEVKPADMPEEKPAEKPAEAVSFEIKVPLGLPEVPIPADNPMTAEKVELGKMLYFDKRVSKDGTISCATCHDPKMAWAERTATSTGIHKQVGGRNSPTVINSAYAPAQFWDGRAESLEAQAVGPVANSIEMGSSMVEVVESFNKIPEYKQRFQKVFGTDVTEEGFAKAVAAFERTVLSGNSPYDKFQNGDKTAMSESAQRGMKLFEEAGCANCHEPPLLSSYDYENAGVGMDKEKPDLGRMDVTKKESDKGAFRIPALRDVASTAPYFHDGSAKTLEEAVALMAAGGKDNPNLSEMLKEVREAKIDAEGQKDLVEFLKALAGEYPIVDPPKLPE